MSSTFYKKGGKILRKIIPIILSITLLFSSCGLSQKNKDNVDEENNMFIATWFTYREIEELCKQSNTEEEFISNINQILTKLTKYKVNNLFLHARAFDDCFYSSSIFPPSEYCKNANDELKFDILKCFIQCAGEYNIKIHAWINPYRIRNDNNISKISPNSFASKILTENSEDERIIITDNEIYYNPAYPDIQNYVLNGIREILENYNVNGIHIDDYFYPTTEENIDKSIYKEYLEMGGYLNLDEFRRNAVNSLISSIYSLVKSYDEDICVSVSPAADIEKNFNSCYADVELWAKNEGYCDILVPQLYYGFNHSTMPFSELLSEWLALNNDNTKIAIGLALYKAGNEDVYAGNGTNEWKENSDIISQQIDLINSTQAIGWAYFSSSYLYSTVSEGVEKEKNNIMLRINEIWQYYVT